ncbi:hypothetical protein KJ925_00895 [Patescibacteria group bacterium]|nr:hypothetical protein [Patescibacteria group bacterium]
MKPNHFFLASLTMTVSLFGAGCGSTATPTQDVSPTPSVQEPTDDTPLVGGDRDEYGCIGSAGYRWCEPKGACLRFWETPCYETDEEPIKAALAEELGLMPADIFVNIATSTPDFAKGSVGKIGEEDGPAGMFLASQGNNIWLIDYHGNGQADCDALTGRGFPTSMLHGVCD